MPTMNYIDDYVNIDDLSDAETVNYTATLKKAQRNYKRTKSKKSIKILNEKLMRKIINSLKQ